MIKSIVIIILMIKMLSNIEQIFASHSSCIKALERKIDALTRNLELDSMAAFYTVKAIVGVCAVSVYVYILKYML